MRYACGGRKWRVGLLLAAFLLVYLFVIRTDTQEMRLARFYAEGRVFAADKPLKGVECALMLSPPSVEAFDDLFQSENEDRFSGANGAFLVEIAAKYEVRRSFLSLFLEKGAHPFEKGWLLLRKEGYRPAIVKLDVSDWRDDGTLNFVSDVSLEKAGD